MTTFWSIWIIGLTLTCILLVVWILFANKRGQRDELTNETMGHSYDGIEELDNPMPKWWFLLFVSTLVFFVGYLLLYPGLGMYQGLLKWSSKDQLERQEKKHERRYGPMFEQYYKTPIIELVKNKKVLKMGKRIFLNNCALCHGINAKGNYGFPNLRDGDWLYGGKPENIVDTITHGRNGQMPAWGAVLGEEGVKASATYVRSLSGLVKNIDHKLYKQGHQIFQTTCSVCHGSDGKGNTLLGAPNLTDQVWLYNSSQIEVEYTIRNGRNGVMPAWKDILGKEKIHIVAAYIYDLSRDKGSKQ